MGEDPRPGASSGSMDFDWVQGPYHAHPTAVAADVLRGWRCPYTCLCLYHHPGVSKVYKKEMESARNKKRIASLFRWGESFPLKIPSSFSSVILAFWLCGWSSTILPLLNLLVGSRDRRFVRDPEVLLQNILPWNARLFCVQGNLWGNIRGPDVFVMSNWRSKCA